MTHFFTLRRVPTGLELREHLGQPLACGRHHFPPDSNVRLQFKSLQDVADFQLNHLEDIPVFWDTTPTS